MSLLSGLCLTWSERNPELSQCGSNRNKEKPTIMILILGGDAYTVKSLIEAWAFIRIITFSGEGSGRLLEAVVLANYV